MKMRLFAALALVFVLASPAAAQVMTLAPLTTTQVVNGTVTVNQVTLPAPEAGIFSMDILIRIVTPGAATGTIQLFIEDSVDGGTTWDDLVSSNTYALGAAIVTQHFFLVAESGPPAVITGAVLANITQGGPAAAETMAAGSARQGPFGAILRVREKFSGAVAPTAATYIITAVIR